MLIYNSKKEFIGIEEHDLTALGFKNLAELQAETDDFADLFDKTPGCVHNFKHISWIDFVECSDANDTSKAIIKTSSKTFKCTLDVKTAYLSDEPSSKAFLVYLNNIREIHDGELENISCDIKSRPIPAPTIPVSEEPVETNEEEIQEEEIEPQTEDMPQEIVIESDEDLEITAPLEEEETAVEDLDTPLNLDLGEEFKEIEEVFEPKEEYVPEETESFEEEIFDNGYIYNPQIASDELGLPVDLIEEFIEDFVAQAKEFKDDLYTSFDEGNRENVKILSHKLKGVAANLRIEDAFETLAIINTSDDNALIKSNLDTFYKIISKLSGEKILVSKKTTPLEKKYIQPEIPSTADEVETEDDEISIDFKDDYIFEEEPAKEVKTEEENENQFKEEDDFKIEFKYDDPFEKFEETISDNEVPQKIEMPELVDDEFLNQQFDEPKIEIDNSMDIETMSDEDVLSIENETIEMDEIELLEGHKDEDTLEMGEIELETEKKVFDKNTAANDIGIPYESFLELFDDYISEAKEISSSISQAVETNDTASWQRKATQLKGMSENIRIDGLVQELEKLRVTNDALEAKEIIDKVENFISEISNN